MTNVVEAGKGIREIQVMSGSQSKSPKGDFEALLKVETETLKTDLAEEGEKAGNSIVIDIEKEVKEPDQEIIGEEPDEKDGAIAQLSYLIQGNPSLQIKNSVSSLKSAVDTEPAGTQLTPAGSLKFQETPLNPWTKESIEAQEAVKIEENSVYKAETSALVQLQKGIPQELKETEIHAIPDDVTETKYIDGLPEKQNKSDAVIAYKNKLELEPKKIEGNPSESKAVPKIEESILKSSLVSSSGDDMENEASGHTQKKSQPDRIENFPSAIKASEFQKAQIPSSPEVTRVESENLEMATKEILHQMETLTDGNKTTVKVMLNPKELGEMEISLSMEEGRLTGKIVVGNKEIQQIFTDKLHELNQTLKNNRIDVASFEVKISSDQNQSQEQSRHQERRTLDYPNRFNSQRNGSVQVEEWRRPANTSNRGIDILA